MCINSKITREEFFGDSIVVWCATILLGKLFSAFTSRKETSETTCEISIIYLPEFMWRRRFGGPTAFCNLVGHIAEQYPL